MKMNRTLVSTITLASLLISLLCGCATDRQAPPVTLRVMSYNIHHGEGLDGKVDLLRIAQLIQEQGADIVGLQEVDKGVERTQRRDLPAELAALTGMTCVFSNNYHYQGGEYGNAVLTKFPVKRSANLHYKMLRPGEQRGILQLVLDARGRELVFLNTHIDYRPDDSERWSNTTEIEELARHYAGKPIIMVGDFNDTPESRVCRRIAETFDDTWALVGPGGGFTIPAANPRKRIDYLWISKDKSLVPLKAWVPHSEASDHLPVVAEFQLK
jgi:endonuclease/exonuclease/phosphatase family metal-dependent hydrolase